MLEASAREIHRQLIGPHDVDVYSYTWRMAEWEGLTGLYDYQDQQAWDPADYARFPRNHHNIFPHWYGVQRACRCFHQYTTRLNLRYDLVVRTRHDIWPYHPVQYHQLDPNLFNVSARHWPDHPSFVFDDNLTVTSHDNYISFYHDLFDWYLLRPMHHFFDISEVKLAESAVDRGFAHRVRRVRMLNFELTRGVLSGERPREDDS